ncbi:MAG TPA: glycosyltransferase family 2 protein [Anaerolineaceae bacterium]|nr:glycosyltransferase family 2 protein [Anaerolineaceae bacterium]
MPRIGTNPSRGKKLDFDPPRVTVAVLVYEPHEAGYFEHRMAVTLLTLKSILANTQRPFELLVFDNGSCPEMVNALQTMQAAGQIDTLILSRHNMGKLNALWRVAQVAQGEVIAYSDDDVYHLKGWLEEELKVLDNFPNVGAVTGFYIKQRVGMSSEKTLEWAKAYEQVHPDLVERGNLITPKWEEEYKINSGRDDARYKSEIAGLEDVVVTLSGIKAFVSAHHFEVMLPKKVMVEILGEMLVDGWSDQLMGRMVEFDDRMDAKGYLRLTTYRQTMRLLGNVIDAEVAALSKTDGIETDSASQIQPKGLIARLARHRKVRNLLQGMVNRLYGLLHQEGR